MMSPSNLSQIVPCSSAPQVLVVASHPPLGEMLAWTLTLSGYSVMLMTPEGALNHTRETAMLLPALLILDTYTRGDRICAHEHLQHLVLWCVRRDVPLLLLVDGPRLVGGPNNLLQSQEHITILGKPFHLHILRQLVWRLIESKAGSHHLLPITSA
jgi:hypothetical protein